jgi:hypothetical protein
MGRWLSGLVDASQGVAAGLPGTFALTVSPCKTAARFLDTIDAGLVVSTAIPRPLDDIRPCAAADSRLASAVPSAKVT